MMAVQFCRQRKPEGKKRRRSTSEIYIQKPFPRKIFFFQRSNSASRGKKSSVIRYICVDKTTYLRRTKHVRRSHVFGSFSIKSVESCMVFSGRAVDCSGKPLLLFAV
ncbi:hypothetical protein CEXT_746911 [Caerostris extrusa]|uniref:Uncharacterized protein n=1 Tax=Caerostris extrusa TaxID=172846 RepID=A0AAV4Y9N9_CAEEX|nr:hypothetical protein CEXT_746911 [Caerostris extrusa]